MGKGGKVWVRVAWLLVPALIVGALLVAGRQDIHHAIEVAASANGNGNGNSNSGPNGNSNGSQGHPFTVAGTIKPLYPGTTQPIDLTFTNPNNQALTIALSGVSATVSSNNEPKCSSKYFSFIQGQPVTVTVAANSHLTLSQAGVPKSNWPAINMTDKGNQDSCKTVGLTLSYTAGATG